MNLPDATKIFTPNKFLCQNFFNPKNASLNQKNVFKPKLFYPQKCIFKPKNVFKSQNFFNPNNAFLSQKTVLTPKKI